MDSLLLYPFATQPFDLQRNVWEATRDRRNYALFWEMGTGKTKVAVDTAGWLFMTGKIDAVFVLAPTDIHTNWDVPGEGIQRHLPPDLLRDSARVIWRSSKAGTKGAQLDWKRLMEHKKGLRWLFMGFDAIITDKGYAAAQQFLSTYRCLWVIDEATRIANPSAKRSKRCMKLRSLAEYRRPMTGSPVTEKPFNAYGLIHWMEPFYWKQNGLPSLQAFKHNFGLWRKMYVNGGREVEVQRKDRQGKPMYQNLEELKRLLRPISSRVLLDDMVDMPPKSYRRLYYEMSPAQQKHYDRLEKEFMTWYEENTVPDPDGNAEGRVLMTSADLAIVRQLRLQQIALGYLVSDEGDMTLIDAKPPGIKLLEEVVEDLSHSAIIWGRFRKDMDLIMAALGDQAVRYDGSVDADGRRKAVATFQAGDVPYFVATQSAAGEGLTLTAARTAIYYSNSYQLTQREQSEARLYRIGQHHAVQYIDLLPRGTICEDILEALMHKQEVAAAALGDRMRTRLQHFT